MMKWNPRLHNRYFWVAMFSLIALTGKVWGLYDVPEGWNIWADIVTGKQIGRAHV